MVQNYATSRIVGLPNVGKHPFNALTKTRKAKRPIILSVIDPNVEWYRFGFSPKPIADLVGTSTIIPAAIEMVDIAGLVEGASKGEGLGNKFLAMLRGGCNRTCSSMFRG